MCCPGPLSSAEVCSEQDQWVPPKKRGGSAGSSPGPSTARGCHDHDLLFHGFGAARASTLLGPIGTFVTVNIRFWASRAAPGRPGRPQNCPKTAPKLAPKLPGLCRDGSSQEAGWGTTRAPFRCPGKTAQKLFKTDGLLLQS
jgi:hypothetical protein